jgi:uncharacterized membrane protein YfcA
MTALLALEGIIVCAQLVETVTGFGATVISLAFGAHLVPLESLVVTLVIIGCLQSLWLVFRGWRHIRWALLARTVLPASAPGLALGAYLFASLGTPVLKLLLGGFIILVSTVELGRLLRRGENPRALPTPLAWGVVFAGGFFHGMFATGGPLMVYFFSRTVHDKQAFRATLSVLWLLLNTVLLVSYAWTGRLEEEPVHRALYLAPALIAGIVLGELLHRRMNERIFRTSVQLVLLGTGVAMVV